MKKFQIGDVAWLVATALAVLVMAFPIIVAVGTVAFVMGPIGRDVLSKVLDTDAFGSAVPVR